MTSIKVSIGQSRVQTSTAKMEVYATKAEVKQATADMAHKSDIPTVPTKVSAFENDKGYLTKHQDISGLATKEEVNQMIAALPQFKISVVSDLPETGEEKIIYLLPKNGTDKDVYNEYLWVENDFELIGTTEIDLTDYLTADKLGIAKVSEPITQAEYEALSIKDENTLYLIKED